QIAEVTLGLTVLGVGVDVVAISRVEKVIARHGDRFAKRVLSASEWPSYMERTQRGHYVAKQFAAKEAISKALGTGIAAGITFHQLVVLRDAAGAPTVSVQEAAQQRLWQLGGTRVQLSISDDADWALAVAVVC
ncbi:MAG: holo-ACP synthase, partial [Gammaproteobacteria bacterium]